MSQPLVAVAALLIGSCVTAVLLVLIKKPLTEEQAAGVVEEVEEEVDLSGISFD